MFSNQSALHLASQSLGENQHQLILMEAQCDFFQCLLFICLAVPGLGCRAWDLWSSLQHAGSFSGGTKPLSCHMWESINNSLTRDWTRYPCTPTEKSREPMILKDQAEDAIVIVHSLSHVWLCDPMDCSTSGLPVFHRLPELAQTHVHWVSDAIQWFCPLLSPSPPAFNLSQHQGLF